MASPSPRRPRGTRVDPVALGWVVERPAKERVEALARNARVSAAVMLEQIVAHVDVTDQGVPSWWESLPRDEELPIDSP